MSISDGLYLSASIICLAMLAYRPFKRYKLTGERRVVTLILIDIFVTSFVSVLSSFIAYLGFSNMLLVKNIEAFIYFFFHTLLAPLFSLYIMMITGGGKNRKKLFHWLFLLPVIIGELMVIISPFTGIIFSYSVLDSGKIAYYRGYGMYYLYIIALFYFLIGVLGLFKTRKIITLSIFTCILIFLAITFVGIGLQALIQGFQIESVMEAIAITGFIMTIDSNDGYYDATTKIPNKESYKRNVNLYHIFGHSYSVINIRILNLLYYRQFILSDDYNELLNRLVKKLNKISPTGAELYQYDHSTFVIIIPGKNNHDKEVFEKVIEYFNLKFYVGGINIDLQTVISFARIPKDIKMPEVHFRLAEYVPTKTQKMTILKDKELELLRRNAWIQEAIQRSIKNKSFLILYHPIWDKDTKRITSCEVLCKIKDAELGIIEPNEFIRIAEESNLILELGDAIAERVCEDIVKYRLDKISIRNVEIDLSLYRLMSVEFVNKLKETTEKYRIMPSMINLEISETSSGLSEVNDKNLVDAISQAGFLLSVDDYGSAIHNFVNITISKFKNIKIDSSILWQSNADPNIKLLLETTIKTFRSIGCNVIQVGVENMEQYNLITKAGVNLIQGNLISKPIQIEELVRFSQSYLEVK